MKRPRFPSDVRHQDFEKVRTLVESARKSTRPKIHDTYDVFCAVLFIVRNEAPWRSLPNSFPPWRSVHHHFTQWTTPNGPVTPLESALEILGLHEAARTVRDM